MTTSMSFKKSTPRNVLLSVASGSTNSSVVTLRPFRATGVLYTLTHCRRGRLSASETIISLTTNGAFALISQAGVGGAECQGWL